MRPIAFLLVILAFHLTACQTEEPVDVADASGDVSPIDDDVSLVDANDAGPALPDYDVASGPLEVGFARVAIPWRVGAKPGQVGTQARSFLESATINTLSGMVTIATSGLPPAELLDEATQWALETLEAETVETEAGVYSRLFEPGLGIEEPPDVKAMVIRRGELKVAVVRADIYLMHEYIHRRVAELVEAETGLGRDQIFLAGTHNHSAPQPSFPAPGVWSLADGFDPRHFVYLAHSIAEAIIAADSDLRPARLRAMRSEFRDVQFNIIGPSTVELASGQEGAEAEEIRVGYPVEHFDGDLDLLYFDSAQDPHEPIALLFAFGMHPETLPNNHGLTSGEFPVHVEKHLAHRLGFSTMWLPGPLGDIEPDRGRNNEDHQFWRESFAALHQMSPIIADAVEGALEELLANEDIEAESEPIFRNIARDIPGTEDFPLPTSAYLMGIRLVTPRVLHGSTLIRLHAIRLGQTLLLGIPAEVTTDLSWNIKSRTATGADQVYQGYVFAENPQWVADRVEENFSTSRVADDHSVPIPIVTSMVNGYMGYIVTRWEYENRSHYRMHMTSHGPETADHIATNLVEIVDEMMGGPYQQIEYPQWLDADLAGADELMAFFTGLDERVAELQRDLPVTDEADVGVIVNEPTRLETSEIDERLATHPAVLFSWQGGTADLSPPRIRLQRRVDGDWQEFSTGPGLSIHLFYEQPQEDPPYWSARWHPEYEFATDLDATDEWRFVVQGQYRSATADAGQVHPIWDPDGADRPYEVVGNSFRLEDLGW